MRVLHLVHQYLPRWVGGVEIYTHTLARALNQSGHTAAVFVRENEEGGLHHTLYEGVPVYRWQGGKHSETYRWVATLGDAPTHAAFVRVLAEFQPDVVHIQHLLGLPASIVSTLVKRNIPHVMTLHDYNLLCANTKLLTNDTEQTCLGPRAYVNCARCGATKAGVRADLRRFAPALAPIFALRAQPLHNVLRQVKCFIAPTEFVRTMHVKKGLSASAVRVLDYGVEIPSDPSIPVRTQGALRVAFVGSVARLKGIHVLVSAFNHLPDDAELRIAGDLTRQPDYVAELRAMAQHPNIHFLGGLDRAATQALMDWADLIAVPSIWYEVSPLVIHEARARLRPVMVGNLGSLPGLVRNNIDGWCVQPHASSAWVENLQELYHNRVKLISAQAQVRVPQSIAYHVAELEKLYSALLV